MEATNRYIWLESSQAKITLPYSHGVSRGAVYSLGVVEQLGFVVKVTSEVCGR